MTWETIEAPPGVPPPQPITVRAQSIPARHYFPEHQHRWNQVVYAISGVLTVAAERRSAEHFPPKWMPVRRRKGDQINDPRTRSDATESECVLVISPEQAVWLPTGLRHRVGSLVGAEFRSLWIADEAGRGLPTSPTVFGVTPLLKALIVEATQIERQSDRDG